MSHFRNGFIFVGPADNNFRFDDDTEDFRFRRHHFRNFDTSSDFDDTTD